MRTWEQLEMQATDDIAASVVGWIAPYEDMLEFALLEDNNALYITNSNAMVLEKNYTQALSTI